MTKTPVRWSLKIQSFHFSTARVNKAQQIYFKEIVDFKTVHCQKKINLRSSGLMIPASKIHPFKRVAQTKLAPRPIVFRLLLL